MLSLLSQNEEFLRSEVFMANDSVDYVLWQHILVEKTDTIVRTCLLWNPKAAVIISK